MKHLLLGAAALAIGACATGYGPVYERADGPYDAGYYETRLDENRYRVQYRTEARDPRLAEDWAFRRAAELTLDRGYDWFQVLSRSSAISDDAFSRYDAYRYGADATRYDDDRRPPYGTYDDDALAVIDVLMGNDPPPRSSNVYDARRIIDETRRRY